MTLGVSGSRLWVATIGAAGIATSAVFCTSKPPSEPAGTSVQPITWPDSCTYPIDDASNDGDPYDSGLVTLNVDTIANGAFINWVGATPNGHVASVISQIAAGNNSTNISALNAHLNTTN